MITPSLTNKDVALIVLGLKLLESADDTAPDTAADADNLAHRLARMLEP